MPQLGVPELIIILAVVLLLFGAKKLPDLANSVGKSIKEFRKASNEADEEEAQRRASAPTSPDETDRTERETSTTPSE